MAKKPPRKNKQPASSWLSRIPPRTRATILIAAGAVAVVAGSVWAYYRFTTLPPPVLAGTSAEVVANYLGDARGYSRLSIPRREEFLVQTYQRFATDEGRVELNRCLRSMSMQERQVFADATVDVVRARVMEFAGEYNRLPRSQRTGYVDRVINNVRSLQGDLSGGGNPNLNVGEPFKPFVPERSDEWQKLLVTRTAPRERAKAQPLIDAVTKRLKETQNLQRGG